jgi:glycosyltransferase involved in cell wall biosynthesis
MSEAPRFSIVVPTRGDRAKLTTLLDALERQTLARDQFELLVVFDDVPPDAAIESSIQALGGHVVRRPARGGPGAARNAGAASARGEYLVFTEDDCAPAPDWLERAASRLDADPSLDVIEGATLLPGGGPVRGVAASGGVYLPTNLVVRRELFVKLGRYCEAFFDADRGIYFREDADFGFTLEATGARIAWAPEVKVEHPVEHPGWLDPLRWARRYEMDPLLASRHPERFRDRIEVNQLGPLRIRRPFVRACVTFLLALAAAAASAAFAQRGMALAFLVFAGVAFLPIWAKWRFDPLRLPVVLVVPVVLVAALVRGWLRLKTSSENDRRRSSSE